MASFRAGVVVLLAGAAAVAAACGGRSDGPPEQVATLQVGTQGCPLEHSVADPLQNCALYCEELGCGCPSDVAPCTAECQRAVDAGRTDPTCLACATDNASALGSVPTCDELVTQEADGGVLYTLEWSESACGSVCSSAPGAAQ